MKFHLKWCISQFLVINLALVLFFYSSYATNGYFAAGYSAKSLGMVGIATAYPQDSLVAAINPAGMIRVGRRIDLGFQFFSPPRRYKYTGSPAINNFSDCVKSRKNLFFGPHFGFNYLLNEHHAIGISIYGNGGLNTSYPRNNPVFGDGVVNSELGFNLLQLIIAPTYSFLYGCNSFGISPLIGLQTFKAKGLNIFADPRFSISPRNVTNNSHSTSGGIGVRIGWLGTFFDTVSFGFAYSTKMVMSRFKKYKGLIAERGKFDIPANLSAGIAVCLASKIVLAFDYQRIFFSDIPSINNPIELIGLPINFQNPQVANKLGSDFGSGSGWNSISVFKYGLAYQVNCNCIVRAGFSHSEIPFKNTQIDANITSPSVVKDHFSIGGTYIIKSKHEIDVAFVHAFKNAICGQSNFGLGTVCLRMAQNLLIFNYGLCF